MTAQKILIIGPSGSGKSYLARKLSAATSIPQTPLDDLNWNNDGAAIGIKRNESDRAARLDLVLQQPAWIMEGIYYKWLRSAFDDADVIILLQPSTLKRHFYMLCRFLNQKLGRLTEKRDTLRSFIALLLWDRSYRRETFPQIIAFTNSYHEKRFSFTSADDAFAFLMAEKNDPV